MLDHVKPEERLRRASDRPIAGWRITVFLLVAIAAAYGLAQRAEEQRSEREAVQLAEQAALVVHRLRLSCGI